MSLVSCFFRPTRAFPSQVVRFFREQSILLDPFDIGATGDFHASRAFVGAAAVNRHGLFQNDIMLVQAQRKLLTLADEIVAVVDSSKFTASAGAMLCALSKVHTLITDDRISVECVKMVEREGIRLITVKSESSERLS